MSSATQDRHRRWLRSGAVLLFFLLVAAIYTRPLLELRSRHIGGNGGDPTLNASILWWSATTVPFSDTWWNPPHFYPSLGVSAFTENLAGILPLAAPVYWFTRDPLEAYNVALFLTWPLSAFAAYLLVLHLTRRQDAAILAGLAFGFTPYRTTELAHIQMLSTYWIPLSLLGLHGYLADRRPRWLALFATTWLLQSLVNLYLMLFGGVLIGLWILYFCSTRRSWRVVPAILTAWVLAGLVLVPILLKYGSVHDAYGLYRDLADPLSASISWRAWTEVSPVVWLWSGVFRDGERNLFPGLVAITVVLVSGALMLRRGRAPDGHRLVSPLSWGLMILTAMSLSAIWSALFARPWRVELGGVRVRMNDIDWALMLAVVCGGALLWRLRSLRAVVARRDPFLFYVFATCACAILACGPSFLNGDAVEIAPAPYRVLLRWVPGFDGLRVPERFWMLGVLCLAVAAGLAVAAHMPRRRAARLALRVTLAAGLLADGWMSRMPTQNHPKPWPILEPPSATQPILELPLGPKWDAAATFRSVAHRRRVLNGVSGYDPPHYVVLQEGLDDHDPEMLEAIASFGSFDVVVSRPEDYDGAWTRYVAGLEGVVVIARDQNGTTYRVPAAPNPDVVLGEPLRIATVDAFRHDRGEMRIRAMIDGRLETAWRHSPQEPGAWVSADLGAVREVGGVSEAVAGHARDFPRRLAIDVSTDGRTWEQVWEGPTRAQAFRVAALAPTNGVLRFAFSPRPARFVRLRQLATHKNYWWIAELRVHAPAAR